MEEKTDKGAGHADAASRGPTFAQGAAAQLSAEWVPKNVPARLGAWIAHLASIAARLFLLVVFGPLAVAAALLALSGTIAAPRADFDVAGVGHFVQDGHSDGVLLDRARGRGASFEVPGTVVDADGKTWKVVGISQCAFEGSPAKRVALPATLDGGKIWWCFEKSKVTRVAISRNGFPEKKRAIERANPYARERFEVVRE